jgi:hypothetical protein
MAGCPVISAIGVPRRERFSVHFSLAFRLPIAPNGDMLDVDRVKMLFGQ